MGWTPILGYISYFLTADVTAFGGAFLENLFLLRKIDGPNESVIVPSEQVI